MRGAHGARRLPAVVLAVDRAAQMVGFAALVSSLKGVMRGVFGFDFRLEGAGAGARGDDGAAACVWARVGGCTACSAIPPAHDAAFRHLVGPPRSSEPRTPHTPYSSLLKPIYSRDNK